MRSSRPLFRVDPGWLFVVAGLAMLVAVVLVPQQQARREAELGLAPLQFAKDRLLERHARYDLAIFQLDEQEPAVMDRLVRSKLHLQPFDAGHSDGTIYISSAIDQPIPEWIDRHLELEVPMPRAPRTTALATLVGSGMRLWVIGAATFSIFIGLVLGGAGEPVAREVARRLLRIPSGAAGEDAVQPHLYGDDEEADEATVEQTMTKPASTAIPAAIASGSGIDRWGVEDDDGDPDEEADGDDEDHVFGVDAEDEDDEALEVEFGDDEDDVDF
ncbi:MAG: hypothetical protein ACYTDE_11720, partial [Planctomycetota bacterium]